MLVVPRYGAYMMTATGMMMLFTNLVSWTPLDIRQRVSKIKDFELGSIL